MIYCREYKLYGKRDGCQIKSSNFFVDNEDNAVVSYCDFCRDRIDVKIYLDVYATQISEEKFNKYNTFS